MVLICDAPRCGARALVDWLNDAGQTLDYCGHCSDLLADAMVAAGWVQVEDERDEWARVEDGPQTLVG